MLLIFGTFCLALAGAALCPDTRLGKLLHKGLIEGPAEGLSLKGLRKAGIGALLLVALVAMAAAPELLAVIAVADLALYVEVAGMMVLLGAVDRVKRAASVVVRLGQTVGRLLVSLPRRATRAPAARRRVRPRRARNDPEPDWGFAFA